MIVQRYPARSNLQAQVPEFWGPDLDGENPEEESGRSQNKSAPAKTNVEGDELALLKALLRSKEEENYRNDVYPDSRKIPTVGIGHKIQPGDNLKLGDRIDDARVDRFFAEDSGAALQAAKRQAAQAGISDPKFITRLAAVNFQSGTSWNHVHVKTWDKIMKGDYAAAAEELNHSEWARQTPKRVKSFRDGLLAVPRRTDF